MHVLSGPRGRAAMPAGMVEFARSAGFGSSAAGPPWRSLQMTRSSSSNGEVAFEKHPGCWGGGGCLGLQPAVLCGRGGVCGACLGLVCLRVGVVVTALAGVRVVEIAAYVAGPYAGALLADWSAPENSDRSSTTEDVVTMRLAAG